MSSCFPGRKRGTLAIIIAILKTARKGILKTHLIGSVSLSYDQSIKYLEYLTSNEFIEKNGKLYKTTQKGSELVEEFESSQLINSIIAA